MTCETLALPGGVTAIVCSRGRRRPRCCAPGCDRPATLLCDHPTGPRRTCDRAICPEHAHELGPDRHLCPVHRP